MTVATRLECLLSPVTTIDELLTPVVTLCTLSVVRRTIFALRLVVRCALIETRHVRSVSRALRPRPLITVAMLEVNPIIPSNRLSVLHIGPQSVLSYRARLCPLICLNRLPKNLFRPSCC